MKIITWNFNMAFRKKADIILAECSDILVVSVCEHPAKMKFSNETLLPQVVIWYGANPHKGLGVFS